MTIFGEILSLALDFSPIATFKNAVEALSGYNMVTFEKLNDYERTMCFVGLIPGLGAITKKVVKSIKALNRVNNVVKIANTGGAISGGVSAFTLGYKSGTKIYDWMVNEAKNTLNTVRLAENNFSDGMDYLRYDNGFIATSVRAVSTVVCGFASAAINIPKNVFKQGFYIGSKILGKSEEETEKSLDDLSQMVGKLKDKAMDKIIDVGLNARFINDIVSPFKTVIDYYNIGSLSPEELDRYLGIENEGAFRYRENLKRESEQNKNEKIPLEYRDPERARQLNNQKYRNKAALDKAKDKIIEEAKKREREKKRRDKNNGWMFPLSLFLPLSLGLLWNTFGILKNIFGNFWKNKFGDGNYGFHTCPYGCQRPIPNAFKGCTELLQAYPNYFG